jgi:hypothetical protein
MEKELYVVYFESANYCGYGEHCLVWATSPEDAENEATSYAEDFYYEQDSAQFEEEHDHENEGAWASFTKEPYPLASEQAADIREYLKEESQKGFYPIVNQL